MKHRVLIVHFFGIGDALFLTPVIRALKEAGTEKIDLLLGSRTKELFEGNPYVNDIFVLDRGRLSREPLWKAVPEVFPLLQRMRRSKYDLLLDYSCRRETSWVAQYWFNIRERIGFDFKNRGFFLTHRVAIPRGFTEKHVMEYYADLLSFIRVPVRSMKMDLFLRPEQEDEAARALREGGFSEEASYVCVSPGGGESWGQDAHFKRWSPEKFAQLLNQLSSVTDFEGIVVLGTQGEKELGERLVSQVKERALNLCGRISLGASCAVLKRSLFHVTNDSGMAHIARALEVPCVSIFGPVDQRIYGPYPPEKFYLAIGREDLSCRPCYQSFRYNTDCAHRECLTELSPEEVFTKILQANFLSALPRNNAAPLR